MVQWLGIAYAAAIGGPLNPLLTRLRLILTALAAAAAFAFASLASPITPSASASDRTIVEVVVHWLPIIDRDEKAILRAEHAHRLERSIARFKHEVSDLHHWARQLRAQRATTRTGATGRNEVVSGINKLARAYSHIAFALGTTLTKPELTRDRRLARAGRNQVMRGIELLRTL